MASRHLARSLAMQTLYEWDFHGSGVADIYSILARNIAEFGPGLEDAGFSRKLLEGVVKQRKKIDKILEKAAPDWPLEKIAIVDRNILRIGLWELLFGNHAQVPPKVAINEAIELAKTFGGETSGRFVNGVLGTVYREMGEPGKDDIRKKDLTPEEIAALPLEERAGAVVVRKQKESYRFAMVHDVFGYWTLSKGKLEKDETPEEAAVREVREELGIQNLTLQEGIGGTEYVVHDPEKGVLRRQVTYFLASTKDLDLHLTSSGGLDGAGWFTGEELENIKTYPDIKEILKKAFRLLKIKLKKPTINING